MITWADVTARAPELSAVALATQTAILADVVLLVNIKAWGAKYDLACTYLAAHMGTISRNGGLGPVGGIESENTGRVSRSYAAPPASDPYWDRSSYGATYKALLKTLPGRVGFVT